jgi:hypothetical protein
VIRSESAKESKESTYCIPSLRQFRYLQRSLDVSACRDYVSGRAARCTCSVAEIERSLASEQADARSINVGQFSARSAFTKGMAPSIP